MMYGSTLSVVFIGNCCADKGFHVTGKLIGGYSFFLYIVKILFPFCRAFNRFNVVGQGVNKLTSESSCNELLALTFHVLGFNKLLYDFGSCCGRSDTTFAYGGLQRLVVNPVINIFHNRQQGLVRKMLFRLRFNVLDNNIFCRKAASLGIFGDIDFFLCIVLIFRTICFPTRLNGLFVGKLICNIFAPKFIFICHIDVRLVKSHKQTVYYQLNNFFLIVIEVKISHSVY